MGRIRRATIAQVLAIALLGTTLALAEPEASFIVPPATPRAECGHGSHPETGLQGRLSYEDHASGYLVQGITCNTSLVGRFSGKAATGGVAGGSKVHRYVDPAGNECAYYDSSLLFPLDAQKAHSDGLGVYVLDMSDPAQPKKTANLVTPAMLSPWESLSLDKERGLLAAVSAYTINGILDVYDLTDDCRRPVLKSSTPLGIQGHEGTLSPDGRTFWAVSGGDCHHPASLTAVDITRPSLPKIVWLSTEHRFHGVSISDDGTRLYGADLRHLIPCREVVDQSQPLGLRILDVSDVQNRVPFPTVTEVARVSWPTWSVPQASIPVTIGNKPHLIEFDEFARGNRNGDPSAPVGAVRIFDIADERHPVVVSDIRLEVHQPENIATIAGDPGATFPLGGYSAHYCSVPQRHEPGILACSFILSGLRVFDIRDPAHPKEIAYFNAPVPKANELEEQGNRMAPFNAPYAMAAPAFAPERNEIWYSDASFGFFNVRVADEIWPR